MIITRRLALFAAAALAACMPAADETADVAAIESLLRSSFDRPDAPLNAGPVVVEGDYAIADWTQGEMGGRALLARRQTGWAITLCSGDGIRTRAGLSGVGVPYAIARQLEAELVRAERGVSRERLDAMSRFEGIVRM